MQLRLFNVLLPALSFSCLLANAQTKSPQKPVNYTSATVFTTADKTDLRIAKQATLSFTELKQPFETQPCVFVDASKTYQTMLGIGAALTDASAETFYKLPKATQQEFMTAYFDKEKGIGYTLGRTNINSCDFSSDAYTYVADGDKELKTFNIAHDEKYKIPFIKSAIAAAGGKLTMYVSPWSPPAWMKSNNSMIQGGKLLPEFMQSWANYYVKFIREYESHDIPVWGLSVQNEPMAKQRWESCIFSAEEERDFIRNFLGPTLQKQGMAAKKLIAWDHNRDLIYHRASTIMEDKEAAKYIWGFGYHWYETWTGGNMQFDNVRKVHEAYPDKQLIFTEGCKEKFSFDNTGDWSLGERYGNSMINDFNNGTAGWTDWNILLDETGGPNKAANLCFAPVHADTRTGKLIYTNSYYYLGHFSKFIRPGAKRIASSSSRTALQTTAFMNTDGSIAVVVMNQTDLPVTYSLWMNGKAAEVKSLARSISTVVVR